MKRSHDNFYLKENNKKIKQAFIEVVEEIEKFNRLNEILKFFAVQSFYFEYRHLLKKQIRDENIRNFVKTLKAHLINNREMSVFSGKIGVFNKKTCINLT